MMKYDIHATAKSNEKVDIGLKRLHCINMLRHALFHCNEC